MSAINESRAYKPLDFGADGVTGSVDAGGRLIALNRFHPRHGYITFTVAEPFTEEARYQPAQVRAYRKQLAALQGFGPYFTEPVMRREVSLLEDAIPHVRLYLTHGGQVEVTTLADKLGAIQHWIIKGCRPCWQGKLSLQRCAYTQLTEGGPLQPISLQNRLQLHNNGLLTLENPLLPAVMAIKGLPIQQTLQQEADTPLKVMIEGTSGEYWLVFAFGDSIEETIINADELSQVTHEKYFQAQRRVWQSRWRNIPANLLLRRGLSYGLFIAVPASNSLCLLTDHMLLPLSWTRDAYYTARALLSWQPENADLIRQHLLWLFEAAERPEGWWGRAYLANGRVKDKAFQLDQQLYPLLELAEYTLETGNRDILNQLLPQVKALLKMLMERKHKTHALFPTDETPADDPMTLPYHFSSHILLWYSLQKLTGAIGETIGEFAQIAEQVREDTLRLFSVELGGKKLFAYATDAAGHHTFYHDANDIPFAFAAQWGFLPATDETWRNTIEFAFSEKNKGGFYDGQLGSVHTPAPWPLGNIQELIIALSLNDEEWANRVRERLAEVAQWDGALPEAYNEQSKEVVSRHWFAWPNALLAYVELEAQKTGHDDTDHS
jgi:hypothetical protein